VYRLICKETVEDKILQRANQKNTVQQLVMTGKHVQGDLLKQEDVVSLLLDDNQLEQKLKEISIPGDYFILKSLFFFLPLFIVLYCMYVGIHFIC
jgi:hypothetical protein